MPAYRFFINDSLEIGTSVSLHGEEFRHLHSVMRVSLDEEIELVNGKGYLALAKVTEINKRGASLKILVSKYYEPSYQLILLLGLPKPTLLDFIVEKGTELGMTEVHIFNAEKSSGVLNENRIERLKAKAISALKQCSRLHLPKIKVIPSIEKWPSFSETAFFGDTDPSAPSFLKAFKNSVDQKKIYLCVGPEGGFSANEVKALKSLNMKGVSLHSNILRVETAALSFLSITGNLLLSNRDGAIIN